MCNHLASIETVGWRATRNTVCITCRIVGDAPRVETLGGRGRNTVHITLASANISSGSASDVTYIVAVRYRYGSSSHNTRFMQVSFHLPSVVTITN